MVAQVYAGDHVSGAHYNPAVTVAVAIRNNMELYDLPDVMWRVGVQLVGAILAALVSFALTAQVRTVSPTALARRRYSPVVSCRGESRRCFRTQTAHTARRLPSSLSSCGRLCLRPSC